MHNKPKRKNAYTRLVDRMLPYQFNWMGRTKEGVSRWVGAPKGPSERFCKYITAYGIIMGIAGTCATGTMLINHHLWHGLLSLALVGGIHGAVFTTMGLWLRKLRRNLERLKTAEELAEEFGSTPETVQRLAESHGVRARININDANLYDPDEFVASRSLLRAASAPVSPETLLRAAEPTMPRTTTETLLRPSGAITTPLTPVQQLFYTRDEDDETEEATQSLRH